MSFTSVNTLQLDDISVLLSESVRNLGVLLDRTLSMEDVIRQTSKSCYKFHRISFVRKYLSTEATMQLVTSLILPCLSFLVWLLPLSIIYNLSRIQNCAARLSILKKVKLTSSHLCFNLSTGSQSHKEFSKG